MRDRPVDLCVPASEATMQTLPFHPSHLDALAKAAAQPLDLGSTLQHVAALLAQLPGVDSVALWAPDPSGAARLRYSAGAGAPLLSWEAGHALRQDFGRRPFLLGSGKQPHYASLGLAAPSVVVFDLGKGHYCGLGLGLPHDGAAGTAVKALRPAIAAWVQALKACHARLAPEPKRRRKSTVELTGPAVFTPLEELGLRKAA
jgi:hypothetical protein